MLAAVLAGGCGQRMATVSGRVTFNGEPVSRGAISLIPTDGKGQTVGSPVEGGSFVIRSVPPGEKTVQVMAVYSLGMKKEDGGTEIELVGDLLPASWGSDSKEHLVEESSSVTKDFAIEGPDPRKK
ncbi:MAG: carboxypeptidase-like regulatory domain-containing protein [Pirellulales bacterium]